MGPKDGWCAATSSIQNPLLPTASLQFDNLTGLRASYVNSLLATCAWNRIQEGSGICISKTCYWPFQSIEGDGFWSWLAYQVAQKWLASPTLEAKPPCDDPRPQQPLPQRLHPGYAWCPTGIGILLGGHQAHGFELRRDLAASDEGDSLMDRWWLIDGD